MKQPEALRLAECLDDPVYGQMYTTHSQMKQAAAELRRLYEANQAMLKALGSILASDDWPEIERIASAAIAKGEQA